MFLLKVQNYSDHLQSLNYEDVKKEFFDVFKNYAENTRLFSCYEFTSKAHRGQIRKLYDDPYDVHLMRACIRAYKIFQIENIDLLCAILLHDTLEDTKITEDNIKDKFGSQVLKYVLAVTKPGEHRKNSNQDETKKFKIRQQMFDKLQLLPKNYRKIWYFDTLDNVYDYHAFTPDSKEYYKIPRWFQQVERYYLVNAKGLGKKYEKLFIDTFIRSKEYIKQNHSNYTN